MKNIDELVTDRFVVTGMTKQMRTDLLEMKEDLATTMSSIVRDAIKKHIEEHKAEKLERAKKLLMF